jgi:hypothetical protein
MMMKLVSDRRQAWEPRERKEVAAAGWPADPTLKLVTHAREKNIHKGVYWEVMVGAASCMPRKLFRGGP